MWDKQAWPDLLDRVLYGKGPRDSFPLIAENIPASLQKRSNAPIICRRVYEHCGRFAPLVMAESTYRVVGPM